MFSLIIGCISYEYPTFFNIFLIILIVFSGLIYSGLISLSSFYSVLIILFYLMNDCYYSSVLIFYLINDDSSFLVFNLFINNSSTFTFYLDVSVFYWLLLYLFFLSINDLFYLFRFNWWFILSFYYFIISFYYLI